MVVMHILLTGAVFGVSVYMYTVEHGVCHSKNSIDSISVSKGGINNTNKSFIIKQADWIISATIH